MLPSGSYTNTEPIPATIISGIPSLFKSVTTGEENLTGADWIGKFENNAGGVFPKIEIEVSPKFPYLFIGIILYE